MSVLVTTDLHLTDKPRDEYRWGLFPWLKIMCERFNVRYVFILGDITDAKDRHQAALVNRIVASLYDLAGSAEVIILKGNHDYIDADTPFFGFAGRIDGVTWITEPNVLTLPLFDKKDRTRCLFIPHTRTMGADERVALAPAVAKADMVLLHQTVAGARASNGMIMEGISSDLFADCTGMVLSGDIHVPQKVGPVEYVGSPYHVHFGDSFKPRCLFVTALNKRRDLHFKTVQKRTLNVTDPERLVSIYGGDVRPRDQVKIRLALPRSEFVHWSEHRRRVMEICAQQEWDLQGLELKEKKRSRIEDDQPVKQMVGRRDPTEILDRYCQLNDVPDNVAKVGYDLLREVYPE